MHTYIDVRDMTQTQQLVESVHAVVGNQGLNLVVNNAGILEENQHSLMALQSSTMRNTFEVNTIGPTFLTQVFHYNFNNLINICLKILHWKSGSIAIFHVNSNSFTRGLAR